MHLEPFADGSSILHHLDPRAKIAAYLPLVFTVALLGDFGRLLAFGALSLAAIAVSGVDRRLLRDRLLVVNVFILLLWITLPFGSEGRRAFTLAGFDATVEGILLSLSITLKANTIFLFTIAFLGTSRVIALAHALSHLRAPRKLVYLFFFFYRYLDVVHEEYERLVRAARTRGFLPKTNMRTLRIYGYLVGMLFVRSYDRSQRVYQALLLRGFKNYLPMFSHFRLYGRDVVFLLSMGVFLLWVLVVWK